MDSKAIILLGLFELIGMVFIVTLWVQRRMGVVGRLFWSVILLVPGFGLLFYGFIRSEPESHSYDAPESTGLSDPGSGDGH